MRGSEILGSAKREFLFVPVAPDKGDREGMELRLHVPLHQRADERGIETAAQVQPHGHIGPQAQSDRLFQLLKDLSRACRGTLAEGLRYSLRAGAGNFRGPVSRELRLICLEVD